MELTTLYQMEFCFKSGRNPVILFKDEKLDTQEIMEGWVKNKDAIWRLEGWFIHPTTKMLQRREMIVRLPDIEALTITDVSHLIVQLNVADFPIDETELTGVSNGATP